MTERFDCHHCENSLFGRKYVLREEQPYCVGCFEALFASTCEECGKLIGCDCKDLSYKDRHWHEACFHCSRCRSSLVDKPFAAKEDQVLCTDCYSQEYSSRCQECRKAIMPGTRKMEYKGSSWHETCFTCHRCQQPIGTKSFIPKDGQNFCVPCYEKQHALQCIQCKKPITSGGVTYREQPWHRECFVCTACKCRPHLFTALLRACARGLGKEVLEPEVGGGCAFVESRKDNPSGNILLNAIFIDRPFFHCVFNY
uniref:Four and a half LIM domains 2 n=1 Tax=Sus scrofa TaxID=9823 RepID=A0A8D0ULR3_PIG